jgi:hypothetical protein
MTKRALILGCSHAAGAEMHKDPTITVDHPQSFGYLNSYPVLIARQLGYIPLNYAVSGGSNDAIFRIFCEQLEYLTSDDIIVACWTGIDRTEIWHELDQHWLPLSIGQQHFNPIKSSIYALSGENCGGEISCQDDYIWYCQQWSKYHVNSKSSKLNKLKNITTLNNLAEARSITVINIDSFYPINNNISRSRPCQNKWAIDEAFTGWAVRNNCPKTDWGHYFLDTHQRFADLVVSNYKP